VSDEIGMTDRHHRIAAAVIRTDEAARA